jgi:Fe-S-cluster-containing dehydrogenase component
LRAELVGPAGRLIMHLDRCRGCRSCELACSFAKLGEFNPAEAFILLDRDLLTERTAPMIRPLRCDLCGGDPVCVAACTYEALTYEKLTDSRDTGEREGGH